MEKGPLADLGNVFPPACSWTLQIITYCHFGLLCPHFKIYVLYTAVIYRHTCADYGPRSQREKKGCQKGPRSLSLNPAAHPFPHTQRSPVLFCSTNETSDLSFNQDCSSSASLEADTFLSFWQMIVRHNRVMSRSPMGRGVLEVCPAEASHRLPHTEVAVTPNMGSVLVNTPWYYKPGSCCTCSSYAAM